jgi:hypothetical protein
MPRKYAYKFFKGELSSDKMLMDIGLKKNLLEFREKSDLQRFKENLLEQLSKEKIQTIVVDYVEDTDLDLWVQLLGVSTINIVRYYPASRRIDVKGMMKYLKAEKERQKKLA